MEAAEHKSKSNDDIYRHPKLQRHPAKYYRSRSSETNNNKYKRGYNPVRISSTTYINEYIGDHHPKGVKFYGGQFIWRMNHDPRRFKQNNQITLQRNTSADIPGYSQYINNKHGGLPFCCWFLLCCGLCIPCCCCCCDYHNGYSQHTNNKHQKQQNIINDNKPLLNVPNNKQPPNVISSQKQPKVEAISNIAYPSYQSMVNGKSINESQGTSDDYYG